MGGLFIPTVRRWAVLFAIVVVTVCCACWLRFGILEDRALGLLCRQGAGGWLCLVRSAATFLYEHSLLGFLATLLAIVNLVWPSFRTFVLGTVAATIGAVLYNVGGAGIAITLLILSLAGDERGTV